MLRAWQNHGSSGQAHYSEKAIFTDFCWDLPMLQK
jgi:hypothetical protein